MRDDATDAQSAAHPVNVASASGAVAGSPVPEGLSPEQYIASRLQQYQTWYDGKAVKTKSRYLRMRTASVVAGAVVPAIVNIDFPYSKAVTTVLSLIVVVLVSLESVYHYREQWKNYRSTEQALGHEKVYYETRCGAYEGLSDDEAFRRLVERVESAIAAENASTLNTMTLAGQVSSDDKGTFG
ncbi:DUF4231 domain-containing protein [Kribbella sp. NPDC049584]|uniref:DUF4231 domain-containing protein n=1 Tax=Kribbella sp. NPDC049584 TaxID=3154833 RepID=UPI00342A2E48